MKLRIEIEVRALWNDVWVWRPWMHRPRTPGTFGGHWGYFVLLLDWRQR